MKISYNWLKWYVPEIPEAEKLADVFTYHLCEVENVEHSVFNNQEDWIFDLNILPNRAHDLLSHQGIARELAGQLGIAYNDPTPKYKIPESKLTELKIDIQTKNCRRYIGRIVRNVKIGPSPEWVVNHLASIGQRSINNVVDATNIVLFDCGQPTHAFDLKRMFSEKIIVRDAVDGEKMTTLDDKHVELKTSDMVIADENSVLAIAGVKGGTSAEIVDNHTTDILLEVANFEPSSVRKTAKRLGIFTDAVKRFENELSPEHCEFGMLELSGLIMEICPDAVFEEMVDARPTESFGQEYSAPRTTRSFIFTVEEINKKLGTKITRDETEKILKNYGYSFQNTDGSFELDVPALRLDLVGGHDMVEEIGRIIGYEKVIPTIPTITFEPQVNEQYARICATRKKLLTDGYSEVMNYAFCKKGKVEVARGAKGKEFLRTNLSDGLKVSYELNRLNAPLLEGDETKIFEIGSVFPSLGGEVTNVAYADKKGVVESTLEEFSHELDFSGLSTLDFQLSTSGKKFTAWSQYPFITRDVAVWVPKDTNADELVKLCKDNGTSLLALEPRLFDQFTKDDKTSLAVRLVFQSLERTLTDAEITEIMQKITVGILSKGWEVR